MLSEQGLVPGLLVLPSRGPDETHFVAAKR